MNGTLFQEPISALIEQKLYEAKMWAERLPEESLTSDKLAEELTKIAHFQFDVAKLKPDERKGKRRTEKRKISDYGRDVTIDVDIIDVIIPFDGYPKSFQIAPSHCNVIDIPAMITHENGLRISLPDDQNLDRAVNFFIERVSGNLSTLEKELQNVGPRMLQSAQSAIHQRLQRIRERQERDKTRSFPIE
ncbi:hypothetical protein IF803_19090 [Bradyrhizobium sp. UFLA06-06]